MNKPEVINFIKIERRAQIPVLQKRFSISYAEAKSVVDELVKRGELVYIGGITYNFTANGQPRNKSPFEVRRPGIDTPIGMGTAPEKKDAYNLGFNLSDEEELRKNALMLCIERQSASATLIQRMFPIGYMRACTVIDWMEEKGYISKPVPPYGRKVLITKEQFEKIFKQPADFDASSEDAEIEDLLNMDIKTGEDEIGTDLDKLFDDDDEEKETPPAKAEKKSDAKPSSDIEKKLKESRERLERTFEEIAKKKSTYEIEQAKKAKRKASEGQPQDPDAIPTHELWDSELEFMMTVRQNIEIIAMSDEKMGLQGAIKKAKDTQWELSDRGDVRMEEVYERVIFELEHMTPYQYTKIKKRFFP